MGIKEPGGSISQMGSYFCWQLSGRIALWDIIEVYRQNPHQVLTMESQERPHLALAGGRESDCLEIARLSRAFSHLGGRHLSHSSPSDPCVTEVGEPGQKK